ncbi:MAG: hypothetical protein D6732_29035, partial [Methanobacteriota archaeon]
STDINNRETSIRADMDARSGTGKSNFTAITNPGATDDSSAGYNVGSRWFNTTTGESYVCVDATAGAAKWIIDSVPRGAIGNIESPLVNIPLNGIKTYPFAVANALSVSAAADVVDFVGLRTCDLTFNPAPAGIAAGQYAIINGYEYPIVGFTTNANGTVVTLEYSHTLPDPTGTPLVQFATWKFAGKYAGPSTYIRTSRKTYIDPLTSLVTGAPAGFPAFERMADGRIGLSAERTSTNLINPSDSVFSGTGTLLSATTVVAPDNVTQAQQIIEDTTNNLHQTLPFTITATAGTTYTYSQYVALGPGPARFVQLVLSGAGISTSAYATFDLTNGTYTLSGASPAQSASITPLPNGWFRLSVTAVADVGGTLNAYVRMSDSYVAGYRAYTGNGTSGITLWGAQLEALPFPSSYIPTNLTSVTRAADSLSIPVIGNRLASSENMSIVFDMDHYDISSGTSRIAINFGVGESHFYVRTTGPSWAPNNIQVYWGNNNHGGSANPLSLGSSHRVAISKTSQAVKLFVNNVYQTEFAP